LEVCLKAYDALLDGWEEDEPQEPISGSLIVR
jgi:hypothetical protein